MVQRVQVLGNAIPDLITTLGSKPGTEISLKGSPAETPGMRESRILELDLITADILILKVFCIAERCLQE